MKPATSFKLVLVTAPNRSVARRLAQHALEARLAACANLIPGIESHYWWQGRVERGQEILIVFKTRARQLAALERLIISRHPYDTPEILAVPLSQGTPRYLNWITASMKPGTRKTTTTKR
jgi:periplasmic divalent cation tolerance protein